MVVALAGGLAVKGTDGAICEAFVADVSGGDDGDEGKLVAGEFTLEGFVFGPGIEAVENDAFLAGSDEVVDFVDDLAGDPVVAFFFADLFAEDFFVFGGDFDAAFFHFLEVHATEIGFRDAAVGKIVDGDGFTSAGHADDGEKFDVTRSVTHGFYYSIGGWFRGDSARWRIYAVEGVIWYNERNETFGDY